MTHPKCLKKKQSNFPLWTGRLICLFAFIPLSDMRKGMTDMELVLKCQKFLLGNIENYFYYKTNLQSALIPYLENPF